MKGQTSAEFLIILSLLLGIFLIFFLIFSGQDINNAETGSSLGAMRNAYALSAALNYAYLAGNGSQYRLNLSKENDENINISSHEVTSQKTSGSAYAPLLSGRTNATNAGGGETSVKNDNGAIEIAQ